MSTAAQRAAQLELVARLKSAYHELPDAPLPDAIATGAEPFLVVGAIAGG